LSPQGVATRQAQRQQIIDEGDIYHQTKEDKIFAEKEKTRLQKDLTDQHIAEAKRGAVLATHETASMPIKYMSGALTRLEGLPEEQRGSAYNTLLQGSGFQRDRLPPELQSYQGKPTMDALRTARLSLIYTPEHVQALQKAEIPAEASKAVAHIQVAGALAELDKRVRAGQFDSDQHMVAALEKAVKSGVDPYDGHKLSDTEMETSRTQLQRYKSSKLLDYVTKQTEMERMARMIGTMSGDPKKAEAANQAYEQAVRSAQKQGMELMRMTPEDLGVQAPKPAPQGQVGEAEVKRAFGSYDPNMYDYRVGPNGVVQRKKKKGK
jgi:hypothetical protein